MPTALTTNAGTRLVKGTTVEVMAAIHPSPAGR
jgi:hypothetical protein